MMNRLVVADQIDVKLGYLYDAKFDSICSNQSILNLCKNVKTKSIDSIDAQFDLEDFFKNQKFDAKFSILRVQPQLQLNIIADICAPNEYTRFLISRPENVPKNLHQFCFKYVYTKEHKNINEPFLKCNFQWLRREESRSPTATHCIVGIKYGYSLICVFKFLNKSNLKIEKIIENLHKIHENIANEHQMIDINENFKSNLSIDCFDTFSFRMLSDISIDEIFQIITENNREKMFRPLELELLPISHFSKNFFIYNEIKLDTCNMILQDYYNYLARYTKVIKLIRETSENLNYIKQISLSELKFDREGTHQGLYNIKSSIKREIVKIQCNGSTSQNFRNLFGKSNELIDTFMLKYEKFVNKLNDIKFYKQNNCGYLDKNQIENYIPDDNVTVLCFSDQLIVENEIEWNKYFGKFMQLLKDNPEQSFLVWDYDVCKLTILPMDKIQLCIFKDSKPYSILEKSEERFNENDVQMEEINNDKQCINIVLLGETGVGKSTFVNAFYNYIKYSSLEEAEKEDTVSSLIGSVFTYHNDDFKIQKIKVGTDENESFVQGESSTQKAKAHKFELGDKIIQIIDTPGMGDVRGIETDKKNFEQTVDYLSKFSHLNAICFLLKPNNVRLSPGFRYCFKELFSHLHKNTVDNLCFCFTNSRSTQYRPGDSFQSIKSYLQDIEKTSNVKIKFDSANIFCLDNEAFRYLALSKNKVDFVNENKIEYYKSWKVSSDSSKKLIDFVFKLPPMKTNDFVMLNKSQTEQKSMIPIVINLIQQMAAMKNQIHIEKQCISKKNKNKANIDEEKRLSTLQKQLSNDIIKLTEASSYLTTFARMNSITVFNDDFSALIEENVRNEHSKSSFLSDGSTGCAKLFEEILIYYKGFLNDIQSRSNSKKLILDTKLEKMHISTIWNIKKNFETKFKK